MLLELNIKNFAIIEDLRVEFEKGLNVITGETGSGKSIIIDALSIVLGQRANKDIIKTGKDYAFIEAVFTDENNILSDFLIQNNIEASEVIIISKEIKIDRPSITKINSRTVTTSVLSKITSKLIDIFAQHENVSLMNVQNQKKLIDFFGDEEHVKTLKVLGELVEKIQILESNYHSNLELEKDKDREMDLLKYQIEEISSANLTIEDDEKVESEFKMLNNISHISNAINESINIINSDYNSANIEDLLDTVVVNISDALKFDNELESTYKDLEDIRYRLKEISSSLISYLNAIDYSEERYKTLEDRLNTVNNLKKKYGNTVLDIREYFNKISNRLSFLENYENEINKQREEIEELKNKSLKLALVISESRKKISKILEKDIERELRELNIKNAKFKINISKKELSKDGIDGIEFMISTNIGEDYKSFSKTASGGEMSRIMLGFKSIIAKKDSIGTLIFDEIDTGISGETAQIVGNKIKALSKDIQIIVISHLPQIVSLGDVHFSIRKEEGENVTFSNIKKLNEEERVLELARLIGGKDITQTALRVAKEMLEK